MSNSKYLDFRTYAKKRWLESNLRSLVYTAPAPEDSDAVVNSTAIIAALLLTLPYSVVGNLTPDFFQNLQSTFSCDENAYNVKGASTTLVRCLVSLVIPCLYVLVSTMLYYVFRPKDPSKFIPWWPRTKFVLLFQVLAVIAAAYAAWFLLQNMLAYYTQYCDTNTVFKVCAWIFWPCMIFTLLLLL